MARRSPAAGKRRKRSAGRVATAIGLVGASAVTARIASANFAGTGPVNQGALTAGDLAVTLADADSSQHFDLAMSDFSPGVSRERLIDVTLSGNLDFKTLQVVTTAGCGSCQTSVLDSDVTNGIQLLVERCSVAWSAPSGASPDSTYTCSGVKSTVWDHFPATAFTSLIGTKDLTTNSLLTAGSVNHYKFTFTLPTASATTTQGKTSIVQFTFSGTQRDGTSK